MTVSNTSSRGDYTENGVATQFPIPFYFLDDTHVKVVGTVAGTATTLLLGSDYTVVGAGVAVGGTLTILTPTNGRVLTVIRNVPFTQLAHYVENDPFPAASHEAALDLLTMQNQQQEELLSRAIVLPANVTGVDTSLPTPVASQMLGFDVSGTKLTTYPNTGTTPAALTDSTILTNGDALVAVKVPIGGAVARTQHQKNQDVYTAADFTDLASAIAGIGASKVLLVINTPVSIAADLTIPSNVTLRVEGAGLITVASGKRLFINGGFQADRFQKCFASSLLTTNLTASINGNALVVTVAAASVLADGHVITGTGVLEGQSILKLQGATGVGTYSLSSYNGVLGSRAMVATGPSVIFGAGCVEKVYPQWWGAIADGNVTDNGAAIAQAIYSMPWGGRVHFPAGKYMVTTCAIVGHPQLVMSGDGATDNSTGSPENEATMPSYIWNGTDNTNLFIFGGNCGHVIFRDLAIGAQLAFGGALSGPTGTNRKGVVFDGHAPQAIFGPRFDNVWFCGLTNGILINDSWAVAGDGVGAAGTYWNGSASITYPDWAVNPGSIQNCHFLINKYGVQFNTSNADGWVIRDSVFIVPPSSMGIILTRCGYLKVDNCFAFGLNSSMVATKFVDLAYSGVGSADALVLDNCQAELMANFLNLEVGSTNDVPPTITVRNCVHQMGADISLGRACDYISQGNEIMSYVYAIAAGVRIHSFVDKFFATDFIPGHATWGFSIAGGDANSIYTYVPGYYPSTSFTGPITKGLKQEYGTSAPGSGAWAVGDRVIRNPPAVGSPKAWSCTVAGSPGTWVSEGNL